MRVILASRSARRQELLARIGIDHEVVAPDIDESQYPGESAINYVRRLSYEKAEKISKQFADEDDVMVVGADTCVELDGVVFGQPVDRDDAERILRALSGRTHNVHTGVTVISRGLINTELINTQSIRTIVDSARVTIAPLSHHILEWYLDTEESYGRAGAYAVQGQGGVLVTRVQGLMSTVVGLPLRQTYELLRF